MPARTLPTALLICLAGGAAGQFLEPNAQPLHSFTGAGGFGWAASPLADITGDGVGEAMISSTGSAAGGYIDVYDGATGALLRQLRGTDYGLARFGWSLADAGDVNNDGVTDIVGGSNLRSTIVVVSGADFSTIRTNATPVNEQLGFAVAGVGDLNGDGFGEVLAGAVAADTPDLLNTGRVYIYSGADGSVLDSIDGEDGGDNFGSAVAGLGDLTGDGVTDFAVGARNARPGNRGSVYVYNGATRERLFPRIDALPTGTGLGQFFVGPAGDADADGTPDIYAGDFGDSALGTGTGRAYVISGATGRIIWTRAGDAQGQGLGCGRAAGDVNGDGASDIIAGAYTASNGGGNAGRALVLSGINGAVLRVITNTVVGQQFGFDAVGIGDATGDGLPELLVAAGGGNAAYVVRGTPFCPADTNSDGALTAADFNAWIIAYTAAATGCDQNLDAACTPADFNAWILNFNDGC